MNWTLLIAAVALFVSVLNSAWQYRDSRRKRRPDVTVTATYGPGPLVIEGERSLDKFGDYHAEGVLIEVVSPTPVMIASGGIAPARGRLHHHEIRPACGKVSGHEYSQVLPPRITGACGSASRCRTHSRQA